MPPRRIKKRRKAQTPPDFKKKKNKVGRGKQVPENTTQISFKSKSVVVPAQLESSPADLGPTTHRKQSLNVNIVKPGVLPTLELVF